MTIARQPCRSLKPCSRRPPGANLSPPCQTGASTFSCCGSNRMRAFGQRMQGRVCAESRAHGILTLLRCQHMTDLGLRQSKGRVALLAGTQAKAAAALHPKRGRAPSAPSPARRCTCCAASSATRRGPGRRRSVRRRTEATAALPAGSSGATMWAEVLEVASASGVQQCHMAVAGLSTGC